MTKDELRAALAEIDARIKANDEAARPAREACRPFDEIDHALDEERELLLERNEHAFVGKCFGCSLVLFEGDEACKYGEDGDLLCVDCAPTIGEALKDWEESEIEVEGDQYASIVDNLRARVAAEGDDVKYVGPL